MKKVILLILFISGIASAQEFTTEKKTLTGIFEVEKKSKSELFSSINKWIAINYNSSKNVIQMNDLESGTIIVKGVNSVKSKNFGKLMYPNNKYMTEYSTSYFNHLIEINIKENRFRIIYKITDVVDSDKMGTLGDLFFNCIDLNNQNDAKVKIYNIGVEEIYKQSLMGKKKRERFISYSKPMFDEINRNLLTSMKLTMSLIQKSTNSKSDDW